MQHYNRELIDGNAYLQEENKLPLTATNTSIMSQHDLERRWQDALNANKFVKELKKKKTGVKRNIFSILLCILRYICTSESRSYSRITFDIHDIH